jgi:hypothetical protein
MLQLQNTTPQQICDDILRAGKSYNVENKILPSEIIVIDNLLLRSVEMSCVYAELHQKLHGSSRLIEIFLDMVLGAAVFWNPSQMAKARQQQKELARVNKELAEAAFKLATLLREREEVIKAGPFTDGTHYSVVRVIEAAAKDHHLFPSHVQEKLSALCGQYDLKYWPSLEACIGEIAKDAENANIQATDPLTAAGTNSNRSSRADFVRALAAAIKDNTGKNDGNLPVGFSLKDDTLATIVNCALNLGEEELVDGSYIKGVRNR